MEGFWGVVPGRERVGEVIGRIREMVGMAKRETEGDMAEVEVYGVPSGEVAVPVDHGVEEAERRIGVEGASEFFLPQPSTTTLVFPTEPNVTIVVVGIWTQLALAYAIHKSFIFIRIPLTAAVTPKVVKVLRGWGWDIGKRKVKATGVKSASRGVGKD